MKTIEFINANRLAIADEMKKACLCSFNDQDHIFAVALRPDGTTYTYSYRPEDRVQSPKSVFDGTDIIICSFDNICRELPTDETELKNDISLMFSEYFDQLPKVFEIAAARKDKAISPVSLLKETVNPSEVHINLYAVDVPFDKPLCTSLRDKDPEHLKNEKEYRTLCQKASLPIIQDAIAVALKTDNFFDGFTMGDYLDDGTFDIRFNNDFDNSAAQRAYTEVVSLLNTNYYYLLIQLLRTGAAADTPEIKSALREAVYNYSETLAELVADFDDYAPYLR